MAQEAGFSERFTVLLPPVLAAQLDGLAKREFLTRSELLRRLLVERLRADRSEGGRLTP